MTYFIIQIKVESIKKRDDIEAWCDHYVGRKGRFHNGNVENWVVRHCCPVGEAEYIFAHEEDAVLFALRWK